MNRVPQAGPYNFAAAAAAISCDRRIAATAGYIYIYIYFDIRRHRRVAKANGVLIAQLCSRSDTRSSWALILPNPHF
jgi:hypothetical protein